MPVVRKTGGLNDTVFDVDDDEERASSQGMVTNGYNFEGTDASGVDYALNRALAAWNTDKQVCLASHPAARWLMIGCRCCVPTQCMHACCRFIVQPSQSFCPCFKAKHGMLPGRAKSSSVHCREMRAATQVLRCGMTGVRCLAAGLGRPGGEDHGAGLELERACLGLH